MPPRGHSHSSHSSSHRSSSRSHSGSRSHSSRSHSSSSHSSSYRGSRSYASGSSSGASSARTAPLRTRSHQPTNYRFGSTHPTTTYRCRRHDYVFYPVGWLDESTNTTYQKGYYDETGRHYDTLILKNNQRYENVPMHCPYCDATTVRDLTDDNETMACENCGGNMIIDAILDERADTASYGEGTSYSNASAQSRRRWKKPLIIMAIIFGISYLGPVLISSTLVPFMTFTRTATQVLDRLTGNLNNTTGVVTQQQQQQQTQPQQTSSTQDLYPENVDIFGDTIYLKDAGDGMDITDESDYDRMLIWTDSEESYYDSDSDCYVWFNTDMEPALWQYWYEGISSYYESGWMEYEYGQWYIETDDGNWVQTDLSGYGDRIWHFSDPHAFEFWEE